VRPSEFMCCVLVADTLNTCSEINVHLYDSSEYTNCQYNLMHLTAVIQLALKAEFVFIRFFGVSTLTR